MGSYGASYWLERQRVAHRGVLAWAATVVAAVMALICAMPAAGASSPTSCPNQSLRLGVSSGLPDCRAYEQVSPVEKGGYNAVDWAVLATAQVAANGERVFYEGNSAFPGAEGNSALTAGHLGVRTESGWRTVELTPRTATLGPEKEGEVFYQAFSDDLDQALFKAPLALTPSANPFAYNLYVRNLADEQSWTSPEYTWLNDLPLLAPASEMCDVPEVVGGKSPAEASCNYALAFAGASSNLEHVLFESNVKLISNAPEYEVEALYENADGAVRLAGVLPDGKVALSGSTAGAGSSAYYPAASKPLESRRADRRVEHAVSESGERVVFEAASDEGESDEKGQSGLTEVYDRVGNSTEHPGTIELSAPALGAAPKVTTAEPATFWAASNDGSRIFFTSSAELTNQSNTGPANEGNDLYEANLEEQAGSALPKVSLRDLSVDTTDAAGAGVLGVVGISNNGEYVYFVADGVLDAGDGVAGKPNLYMERDGGKPIFIATLQVGAVGSEHEEEVEPGDSLDWTPFQEVQRAYVTPNGRHLGFMSLEKLSTTNFPAGYDNVSRTTELPVSEVYEYNAPSPQEEAESKTGDLLCASCDPTGTPPSGNAFIAGAGVSLGTGPTEETGSQLKPTGASSPFYHVHAVSNSGSRVFFTATPFASETVVNNAETPVAKVYEYEQSGEGSCATQSGCTYRISGATNPTRDLIIGASDEGNDIFFATYSQLTSSDEDDLMDVYDARVDGGFPPAKAAAECESGCRTAGAATEGPSLVSGLTGPSGNLASPAAKVVKKVSAKPKLSCSAKAKKIKNAKARKRALRKCRKTSKTSHGKADRSKALRGKGRAGQ